MGNTGKERVRTLPLLVDFIWNIPDYVNRAADRYPKFGKPLRITFWTLAVTVFLLALAAGGVGMDLFSDLFSKTGHSLGVSLGTIRPAILIFGVILMIIVTAAKRYNKLHGHDPESDSQ